MFIKTALEIVWPFLASLAFVTLNEMGDKTQLLAMAFGMRMKFWKVMTGVFIATVLNHGLAVAAGSLLARVPGWQGWIQFIAALLFIVFGLWALMPDKDESKDDAHRRRAGGDIATVATGFFFAEMGDKTQLATITLSAKYADTPLLVLAGTTCGMLIADGLGIFIGVVLGRKIPGGLMRILASLLFLIFGLAGVYGSLKNTFHVGIAADVLAVVILAVFSALAGIFIYGNGNKKK